MPVELYLSCNCKKKYNDKQFFILDEPRGSGFKIFHDANSSQLRVEIATAKKKWKAILHKIPSTGRWFHLIFTWSQGTGLQISINGQFLLSSDRPIERKYSLKSSYEQNGIFIGGKDSSDERTQHVQYDIGHLAFWNYVLDVREIQHAYRYTIIKNAISQMCCIKLSGKKCATNFAYQTDRTNDSKKKAVFCKMHCILQWTQQLLRLQFNATH